MSSQAKVLIIGAGLGGLVLAQALRKREIDYEIFERDQSAVSRSQGWAITLSSILEDLRSSLPSDMPPIDALNITHSLAIPPGFSFFEATTGLRTSHMSSSDEKPYLRVNRQKLRAWLMTGLNINFGKRFKYYSESDGTVSVFFEDGSSVIGSVLVGADGVHSRVRSQLDTTGTLALTRIPLGNIVGQCILSREQYESVLELGPSFYVASTSNHRLFVGVRSISDDKFTAEVYWILSWIDEAVKSGDSWIEHASAQQLLRHAQESCSNFNSSLKLPVTLTTADGIASPSLVFRDMLPEPLPRGLVTLLGDAIHPVSPFRGEGGNHAMQDGLNLAKTLSEAQTTTRPAYDAVLKRYEEDMLLRGRRIVMTSREVVGKSIGSG